jgi:hypothetical protein
LSCFDYGPVAQRTVPRRGNTTQGFNPGNHPVKRFALKGQENAIRLTDTTQMPSGAPSGALRREMPFLSSEVPVGPKGQETRSAQPSIKRPMATIQLPATRIATRAHCSFTEAA